MSARRKVAEAEGQVAAAKEALKEAKAVHEAAVGRLLRLIDEVSRPPEPSLFDGPPGEAGGDEGWQDVPLEEVLAGLPPGVLAALAEAELTTVGHLAAWTAGGKQVTDVPGIGEAKAAKIDAALEEFWDRWKAAREVDHGHGDEGDQDAPAAAVG